MSSIVQTATRRACAIMQPTYLPWSGYFNLIARVDVFVLLDDVQFQRRSWQMRNRIMLNGQEHLLTIPTCNVARDSSLADIRIDYVTDWRSRHWKTLQAAYAKAPHGPSLLDVLSPSFIGERVSLLCDFNLTLLSRLKDYLGIKTPLVNASSLNCVGKRSEHLLNICQAVKCNHYLSPAGSQAYLQDDGFAEQKAIALEIQRFDPGPYLQYRSGKFVSHLSVIDVLANLGAAATREYITAHNALKLDEVNP